MMGDEAKTLKEENKIKREEEQKAKKEEEEKRRGSVKKKVNRPEYEIHVDDRVIGRVLKIKFE